MTTIRRDRSTDIDVRYLASRNRAAMDALARRRTWRRYRRTVRAFLRGIR